MVMQIYYFYPHVPSNLSVYSLFIILFRLSYLFTFLFFFFLSFFFQIFTLHDKQKEEKKIVLINHKDNFHFVYWNIFMLHISNVKTCTYIKNQSFFFLVLYCSIAMLRFILLKEEYFYLWPWHASFSRYKELYVFLYICISIRMF